MALSNVHLHDTGSVHLLDTYTAWHIVAHNDRQPQTFAIESRTPQTLAAYLVHVVEVGVVEHGVAEREEHVTCERGGVLVNSIAQSCPDL